MSADPRQMSTPQPRGQVLDRELLGVLRQLRRGFGAGQVHLPAAVAAEPTPLRLLVCGSRAWTDRTLMGAVLDRVAAQYGHGREVVVVHGDARGADRLAGELARQRGWKVETYPADWEGEGRGAGPRRNARMLTQGRPDRVVAFTRDLATSRGTADMVGRARAAGRPVEVVEPLTYRGYSLTGSVGELRRAVDRLRADTIGTLHDHTQPPATPPTPAPEPAERQRRLWDAARNVQRPPRPGRQRPGREGVEPDGPGR